MSDASEAVASDLERALALVARAVAEAIPENDVFEPQSLVRRWMAGLAADDRGRFLVLLLSNHWEEQLGVIARAVLAGAGWPAAAHEVTATDTAVAAEGIAEAAVTAEVIAEAAVTVEPELANA